MGYGTGATDDDLRNSIRFRERFLDLPFTDTKQMSIKELKARLMELSKIEKERGL